MDIRDNISPNSFDQGFDEPTGYGAFDEIYERSEDNVNPRKIETSKIDNIQFDDVHMEDAPDFVDAWICSADMDGIEMTPEELELLNEDKGFVYEKLIDKLY